MADEKRLSLKDWSKKSPVEEFVSAELNEFSKVTTKEVNYATGIMKNEGEDVSRYKSFVPDALEKVETDIKNFFEKNCNAKPSEEFSNAVKARFGKAITAANDVLQRASKSNDGLKSLINNNLIPIVHKEINDVKPLIEMGVKIELEKQANKGIEGLKKEMGEAIKKYEQGGQSTLIKEPIDRGERRK